MSERTIKEINGIFNVFLALYKDGRKEEARKQLDDAANACNMSVWELHNIYMRERILDSMTEDLEIPCQVILPLVDTEADINDLRKVLEDNDEILEENPIEIKNYWSV